MGSTFDKFKNLKNFSVMRKVFSLMGNREKIAVILLAMLLVGDALYLCNRLYIRVTRPVPTFGGAYREGIVGQPRLLNPAVATSNVDQSLIRLAYSALYAYDTTGQIVPDLAESLPDISDDAKQYTIHLRKNAVWHDGKPVTSSDVVFTVHLIQDSSYNSPQRGLWLNTEVEQQDDYTLVFSNKDVSAPFIHNLTLPIMPEHIWQNVSPENFLLSNNNLEAVGSGPFVLKEIKKLPSGRIEQIKFESFSNYYNGKPYISSITTVFYDSNEELVQGLHGQSIDGFGYTSLDSKVSLDLERNNLSKYNIPLPQYQAVFLNVKDSIFADPAVRTALKNATNIQDILSEVYGDAGRALKGPILPEQEHKVNAPLAQSSDLANASSILDTAGWKVGANNLRAKGKTPLEFTLSTNDLPTNTKTAELLVKQWEQLHITVHLNILPTKDLAEKILRPRTFDALLFAVKLPQDPDPFQLWHSSQAKDPGLNITQFSNPEVDKLISEARSTVDWNTRLPKYERIEEIIIQADPAIFVNQTTYVYTVKENIKGISFQNLPDPSFRFANSRFWYTTEKRSWK